MLSLYVKHAMSICPSTPHEQSHKYCNFITHTVDTTCTFMRITYHLRRVSHAVEEFIRGVKNGVDCIVVHSAAMLQMMQQIVQGFRDGLRSGAEIL